MTTKSSTLITAYNNLVLNERQYINGLKFEQNIDTQGADNNNIAIVAQNLASDINRRFVQSSRIVFKCKICNTDCRQKSTKNNKMIF